MGKKSKIRLDAVKSASAIELSMIPKVLALEKRKRSSNKRGGLNKHVPSKVDKRQGVIHMAHQ